MIQSIPQTPWATPDGLDMPGLMTAFQAFWRENSGEEAVRLMALRLRHPFARLCVLQSIWQLERSVAPPLLHAATWSASISENFQIRFALASCPTAQSGQFETLKRP